MLEMLDFVRSEFEPAYHHYDEDSSIYRTVAKEEGDAKFTRFNDLRNDIINRQYNVRSDFFEIAKSLYEIRRDKLYNCVRNVNEATVYGYSNFYTFCEQVLGFKKTTVYNLLNVYEKFVCENAISVISSVNFSYSQLVALLDVDDKYKARIPVQTSVRDIKKLADYYKSNVPGNDVETDLKNYKTWKAEENARKNAKKNKISFVPAKSGIVVDFDDEDDENDVLTPDVSPVLREDQVINGLLRQLDLLKSQNVCWSKLCDIVSDALRTKTPRKVAKSQEVATLNLRIIELQKLLSEKDGQVPVLRQAPTGKLDFKNDQERKTWLEHFDDWGVWVDVPSVRRRYYRYDFINGASVVVELGYEKWTYGDKKAHPLVRYNLMTDGMDYVDMTGCGGHTAVLKYMSEHRKEI